MTAEHRCYYTNEMEPCDAMAIEHEIQRQMVMRLGIVWAPGEPFYSVIEAEIVKLREQLSIKSGLLVGAERAVERLREPAIAIHLPPGGMPCHICGQRPAEFMNITPVVFEARCSEHKP